MTFLNFNASLLFCNFLSKSAVFQLLYIFNWQLNMIFSINLLFIDSMTKLRIWDSIFHGFGIFKISP